VQAITSIHAIRGRSALTVCWTHTDVYDIRSVGDEVASGLGIFPSLLYAGVELRYAIPMECSMGRVGRYLSWLVGRGALVGVGTAPAPTVGPTSKGTAPETKPAKSPSEPAAATPAVMQPQVNDPAKPVTSPSGSAAAPTAALAGKSSPVSAAPNASSQPPPASSAETPAPAIAVTSAAPEAPPPPPVESPKQTGQAFSVWLQSSGRYTAGQQGIVEAVVVPKGEFHCNQEYPYKFVASAGSSGVTYPKPTLRAEGVSVSPTRAVMRIPFVPQNAGEAKVGGTFHFSVCTDQQCVVEKRDVSVTVKVQ